MSRVLLRPKALLDLADIADHISHDSPAAALRFLNAVEQSVELLSGMPELGSQWMTTNPELVGMRFWTVRKFDKYVVFYRPVQDGVEVVRVLHGSQDLNRIFSR